jgi:hypothetical protein
VDRLEYFLNFDDRGRRRAILIAMLSGATAGMYLEHSGVSFNVSACWAIGILTFTFLLQVTLYIYRPKESRIPRLGVSKRALLKFGVVAAGFLVAVGLTAPTIEAGAIRREMRAAAAQAPLSPDDAQRVTDNMRLARSWKIPVGYPTIVDVGMALKKTVVEGGQIGPVAKSATALLQYARADSELKAIFENVPPSAKSHFQLGMQYISDGFREHRTDKFDAALDELTAAINESDENQYFKSAALLNRGVVEVFLGNLEAASADTQQAENLGSFDLPVLAATEGTVLANQTDAEDWRKAIRLLTFALQVQDESDPNVNSWRSLALGSRAMAFMRLGEYENALSDAQRAILGRSSGDASNKLAWELMILSYVGLGDYAHALDAATDYLNNVGGTVAYTWLAMIRSHPNDLQYLWGNLYPDLMGTRAPMPVRRHP